MWTECNSTRPARPSMTVRSQLDHPFFPQETKAASGSRRLMARAHRVASATYSLADSEPT